MKHINLEIPEHSYFFGFAQADGSLTASSRNRGKLQIELNENDLQLLKSFRNMFVPLYSSISQRQRDTNFKKNHKSYVWAIFNLEFRREINSLGLPYGKKSEIIASPSVDFCERDYIRGLVDGDGSVGMAKNGRPFISLVLKSESLKDYLFDVIEKITGQRKELNRNRRDNVYNIMLNREKAQRFISYLYYPDCLTLQRKLGGAKIALRWKRPKNMRRPYSKKRWEGWEDKYILTHPINESCNQLGRTRKSVGMRLWRLSSQT